MICFRCREDKPADQMVADKRAKARGWNAGECKACKRKRSLGYSPSRKRDIVLRRRYGITGEVADAMLAAQGGVCAICQAPPKGSKRLYIDHDHDTGAVRGILCPSCNTSLEWLLTHGEKARRYLSQEISERI